MGFFVARTRTPPPSTKIGRLKSTVSIRDSVIVVVPQSASTLPAGDRLQTRRRLDRHPLDPELGNPELLLDRGGDARAEVDAVAPDAPFAVLVRERRRGVAIGEDDRAPLLDPVERRRGRGRGLRRTPEHEHADRDERCRDTGRIGAWEGGREKAWRSLACATSVGPQRRAACWRAGDRHGKLPPPWRRRRLHPPYKGRST